MKHINRKKSIFRAIFVPLILIMILQGAMFYFTAVYGGIESSLNQNAADILSERLTNRKNEIETHFNKDWTELNICEETLSEKYEQYTTAYGDKPFIDNTEYQIQYLSDATDILISTLRDNRVNGVFLILNDKKTQQDFSSTGKEEKYGLCIRDMDATSAYTGTEDLLLERSPSSIVEKTGCSLDSWWEARYSFQSEEEGSYFYEPLQAAWENQGAKGEDIAYFCGAHHVSRADLEVVSYSIPLVDDNGYPYAVLGVELTTKYLSTLLPSKELNDADKSCYILALWNKSGQECVPITSNGALYNRCFSSSDTINCGNVTSTGGFEITGRNETLLYGDISEVDIYNNNNPFEQNQLVLIAFVEKNTLFYYSQHVKRTLLLVSALSLFIGVLGIFIVSRHFAAPITALARKARNLKPQDDIHLEHLGIVEIDQLVDSIEGLNENVSKEIARTDFFSRMSHDMRTPMNAIISFSSNEMLEEADEKQKDDYLTKIHTSGEYLLGLINEVLDMTKIESNKVDLHFETMHAKEMWDTVLSIVDKLAQKQKVHFIKNIQIPSDLYVKADIQHLSQIVMNLLSNAVKFTPENGEVVLNIKIEQQHGRLEQKNQLEQKISEQENLPSQNMSGQVGDTVLCSISVRDSGIGMSEEFMKKLYTPFEQETTGHGGTGLGLSISKKLVDLLQGSIQCESQKDVGTTFYVSLPLLVTDMVEHKADDKCEQQIFDEVLKGKRILLCEDHPLNTQIAKKLLERKEMVVETAVNGAEGAEKFAASEEFFYDAILMDIRMPVLDGLGAAKKIRSMERKDAVITPIIAMTANAFEEDIRQSRAAGMNAHLSKPIEPEKLYQTLTTFLNKRVP